MSITLPTSSRPEIALLARRERLWASIATGLRQEVRRPAAIAITVLGAAFTTITSIILLFLSFLLPAGQGTGLSFFAVPASNPFVLFFVSAMAAVIGSGLIADDIQSMTFTVYLNRPITQVDHLLVTATILAPLFEMVSILPHLRTA